MKLGDMKAQCRKCGKELRADSKDSDFVTFYCMQCGIYTNKPVEDFKDPPAETAACPKPTTDQQPGSG